MNLSEQLRVALATIFSLYLRIHHVHLNIEGPDFFQYHKMLDEFYKEVFAEVDSIAEEIRALDIYCVLSYSEFLKHSLIEEDDSVGDAYELIHGLLLDNDKALDALGSLNTLSSEHPGLQNHVQELMDRHNWWGYALRSSLKGR